MAGALGTINSTTSILETSDKGVANGVASLDPGGKVPSAQLPSSVSATIPQSFSFTRNGSDFLQETSGTYVSMAKFIYAGSSILGVPTTIKVNAWNDGGTSISIQIFDVTNGLQVAEVTGVVTSAIDNIQDLGVLANIPLNAALFEVRLLLVGGGMGDQAKISSLTIY